MLHESEQDPSYRFSTVRLAVSAAEPLPGEIYRRWKERFGCDILDGIGSTEVLHIYASARPGRIKPGSVGEPVSGYELRISSETGADVASGEVGDLWIRGQSTALCYWNQIELTRQRMQGDWFFSGDKFYKDEEGYFWYAGRSDDMFRVSGEWVSPIEVENTLIEHAAVLESAVVPYQDENNITRCMAYVVLKPNVPGHPDLAAELQSFVKTRITGYKVPRRLVFLAELPKTASGKIQRFKLRDR
jgi:benzoate-CoA ligase